jgi:hypothetical protein
MRWTDDSLSIVSKRLVMNVSVTKAYHNSIVNAHQFVSSCNWSSQDAKHFSTPTCRNSDGSPYYWIYMERDLSCAFVKRV